MFYITFFQFFLQRSLYKCKLLNKTWLPANMPFQYLLFRNYLFCYWLDWVVSVCCRYPVILSLENHCSVPMQRVMAKHLQEILGGLLKYVCVSRYQCKWWVCLYVDLLYTTPPDAESRYLPSPEELKGKILVKVRSLLCLSVSMDLPFFLQFGCHSIRRFLCLFLCLFVS